MSRNTDTVKAAYEAFGRGDIAAILDKLADDVEWEHDWGGAQLRWYVSRRGRDNVAGFFQTLDDFDFLKFEPFAFLEDDGMVVSLVRLELRVKATGKGFKDLEAHLWTFGADGQVAKFRHLADTHQLAAVTA
ncbi:nuclear transport factor 2 family protein [Phreatobacter stygius]|nr:nuclear transport factor 2 family protein [Phreatobacter stygius]